MNPQRRRLTLTGKKFTNQYSYLFDGTDEYINIDSVLSGGMQTQTTGTFSLWIKPVDATPGSAESAISFNDFSSAGGVRLDITPAGQLSVRMRNAAEEKWHLVSDNAVFSDNTWTHIALIQSGETRICIDSIDVDQSFSGETNKSWWFNDDPNINNGRIGNLDRSAGVIQHFNGNIDEVGFFNTGLSLQQIKEIYNNGKPKDLLKHSASGNLVSYFRMGDGDSFDGTNFTLIDKKGNNNGTSVNMELVDKEIDTP